MSIKDQISAEIRRRIAVYRNPATEQFDTSKARALEGLLDFLHTIPEQPMMCSKDDYHWEGLKELLRDYQKTIDRQHNNMAYESVELYIDWIDSLPEQPVEGLEEAAENYIAPIENDEGLDYINFNGRDIKDAFIAGAEWMKEKDTRDMYMSDNRHFQKVYELGKKDMKKQMMEGAVEAVVTTNLANRPIIYLDQLQGFQYGDKVRVIVIKEDEL